MLLHSREMAGLWRFETVSAGVTPDSSGNDNHGTVIGATLAAGKLGQCLHFDGVDDRVDLTTWPITNTEFTVAAWALREGEGGGGEKENTIFCQREDVGGNDHVAVVLVAERNNLAQFYVRSSSGEGQLLTAAYPGAGWHHYCGVAGVSGLVLYIDTIQVDTQPNNQLGNYTTNIDRYKIGQHWFPPGILGAFNGKIDEVPILNRALSETDIRRVTMGMAPVL